MATYADRQILPTGRVVHSMTGTHVYLHLDVSEFRSAVRWRVIVDRGVGIGGGEYGPLQLILLGTPLFVVYVECLFEWSIAERPAPSVEPSEQPTALPVELTHLSNIPTGEPSALSNEYSHPSVTVFPLSTGDDRWPYWEPTPHQWCGRWTVWGTRTMILPCI